MVLDSAGNFHPLPFRGGLWREKRFEWVGGRRLQPQALVVINFLNDHGRPPGPQLDTLAYAEKRAPPHEWPHGMAPYGPFSGLDEGTPASHHAGAKLCACRSKSPSTSWVRTTRRRARRPVARPARSRMARSARTWARCACSKAPSKRPNPDPSGAGATTHSHSAPALMASRGAGAGAAWRCTATGRHADIGGACRRTRPKPVPP
jgi:hypothetical protein